MQPAMVPPRQAKQTPIATCHTRLKMQVANLQLAIKMKMEAPLQRHTTVPPTQFAQAPA